MLVNFNVQRPQQNFGMAIYSNENVNKAIKSRIKNPEETKKLNDIIEKQTLNNLADIILYTDGKNISAKVVEAKVDLDFKDLSKEFNENAIRRMFGGGVVGLIEKAADYAEKIAATIKTRKAMDIGGILNKIKKV